jgi:hypothetical protein
MSNTIKKLAGVAGRLLLAYLLVFAQSVWAGQEQGAKENPEPAQTAVAQSPREKPSSAAASAKERIGDVQREESENAAPEEKSSGDGKHEGIKVHGHWTIEVRNSDGSVVAHREFENSLQPSGASALASLLAGAVPGPWEIRLNGSASTPSPCPPAPTGTRFIQDNDTSCVIVAGVFAATANSNVFPNLTVNSSGTGQLVLTGTAVASQSGGVATVSTYITLCLAGSSQASCAQLLDQLPPQFTAVSLDTGSGASPSQTVQVTAGQTIAVTVNISFS